MNHSKKIKKIIEHLNIDKNEGMYFSTYKDAVSKILEQVKADVAHSQVMLKKAQALVNGADKYPDIPNYKADLVDIQKECVVGKSMTETTKGVIDNVVNKFGK